MYRPKCTGLLLRANSDGVVPQSRLHRALSLSLATPVHVERLLTLLCRPLTTRVPRALRVPTLASPQVYWPSSEENGERVVPTLAAMALYRHAVPTVVLAAGAERAGGR